MMMVKRLSAVIGMTTLIGLSACGGNSSSGNDDREDGQVDRVSMTGVAVKGPLALATVSVYQLDLAAANLKGALITTGQTAATSFIENTSLSRELAGQTLLIEFSSATATTDINTGSAPLIPTFTTVIKADALLAGGSAYGSPLTHLTVKLAQLQADTVSLYQGNGDGVISAAEFDHALTIAAQQVLSTLGLGWAIDADLLNTPPLVTNDSASNDALKQVLLCRQAVEGVAVITNDIATTLLDGAATAADVVDALALDLTDGIIDGQSSSGAIPLFSGVSSTTLQARITANLANKVIPGTNTTVANIETLLVSETAVTAVEQSTSSLSDNTVSATPALARIESDIDGDGIADRLDAYPQDSDKH